MRFRVTSTPVIGSELSKSTRGWFAIFFLVLAGYLLFAHGCHGDEDTELFLPIDARQSERIDK